MDRRMFLRCAAATWGAGAVGPLLTACGASPPAGASTTPLAAPPPGWLTDGATDPMPPLDPLVHLLRRTRFGFSQQDYTDAAKLGIDGYLDDQLAPAALPNAVELLAAAKYYMTPLPSVAINSAEFYQTLSQQLSEKTVFLAAYSPRQLFEVMVDFWSNHFNVDNLEDSLPVHKVYDDREVIRPNAFGTFRDLLHATAKSPAMLVYLDTVSSHKEHPNENYAREMMELHTLGYGGGYTEDDVKNVARCFTGWNISSTLGFQFNADDHDAGEKTVLGHLIPAGGGVSDGETVLDIMAAHPSTARFVSTKLARRFVSDNPPSDLVDRLAAVFTASGGDVPTLLRALFKDSAFTASADRKYRRPLEYVAGALRTFDNDPADFDSATVMNMLSRLGQTPHRWFPPNGYPDLASYWFSVSGQLERWNYAAQVATRRGTLGDAAAPVVSAEAASLASETPAAIVDRLTAALLQRTLRDQDRVRLIAAVAGDNPPEQALTGNAWLAASQLVAGLLLASPYFVLR